MAFLLERHNQEHRLGRVLTGEAGVIVARGPDTVRGADVAFISHDRLPAAEQPVGFFAVPPELVVAVLGDVSWMQLEAKIAQYHAFGVETIWVLEAPPDTVTSTAGPAPLLGAASACPAPRGKTSPTAARETCFIRGGAGRGRCLDPRMLALRVYPRQAEPFVLQQHAELTAAHPAGFSCRMQDFFA